MAELLLEKLTKRFGPQVAVDGLDLRVGEGELLVLVGPSGCGKTTTLRMIAGLERASGGRIRIGPRYVDRLPPRDRRVAMVFQELALLPHRTVRGNLAFGRDLRGAPRRETTERVQRVARLLGLEDLLLRKPAELSGGQQQRVAFGRALVSDADILLLDEPFSDLDAPLRMRLRSELVKLQRRLGQTIVHVTHDQVEAMMVGQRIAVMRAGRIQQVGPPLEVYQTPENRFVAEFLGSQPMNFLRGRVLRQGEHLAFSTGGLQLRLADSLCRRCRSWVGRDVELGVRPEDVRLRDAPDASWQRVRAAVQLVQPTGSQAVLDLDLGGIPFVASADAGISLGEGAGTDLFFPPDRLHLFDPATGHRI